MTRDNMDKMANDNEMTEAELREKVSREMVSDAVEVDRTEGVTTISLLYHEPEKETELVQTPMGVAVTMVEPETDALIAELMDDVQSITSPDRMDVEDKNGFYVVELTFQEGNSW